MPKSKKPFKKAYLEITSQCNLESLCCTRSWIGCWSCAPNEG